MAPEQASGDKGIDRRADIYAVGVVLYEALTGVVPFKADNVLALIRRILDAPLVPPRDIDPDIPEALEAVILKAMARKCEDRFATAAEMLAALMDFLDETTASRISLPEELSTTAAALPKTVAVRTSELSDDDEEIGEGATEEAPVAQAHKGPDTDMAWTGKTMPTPTDAKRKRVRIGISVGVVASAIAVVVVFLAWPTGDGSNTTTQTTAPDPAADAGAGSPDASTADITPSAVDGGGGDVGAGAQHLAADADEETDAESARDGSGLQPVDEQRPRRPGPGKRPPRTGKRPASGGQTAPTSTDEEENDEGQTPPSGQTDGQGNPVLRQDFQI
jgi:hypothetical protein